MQRTFESLEARKLLAGDGLSATYFDQKAFGGESVEQSDARVAFDWADGAPVEGFGANGFSVRWSGLVEPRYSETYTFHTQSEGGVRLWVNGKPIIDHWQADSSEQSGTIALTAGKRYDLRLEYFDARGDASVDLSWSSRSQKKQIIPKSRLYSYTTRFGVLGDFGTGDENEQKVADLVNGMAPDYLVTVGDNNYPDGAAETIDPNIGKFFSDFIYNYQGDFGAGSDGARFFPALGNHDVRTDNGQPQHDYFTLPGNERYYDVVRGPVHLFVINTEADADGSSPSSKQGQWLKRKLAASKAQWKLVVMHRPPYSSGTRHGPSERFQWPFAQWGADAVLAGHEHSYERIHRDGIPFLVNGLGSRERYPFGTPVAGSKKRFNDDFGAMFVHASNESVTYQFIDKDGTVVDTYTKTEKATNSVTPLVNYGSSWRFLDDGADLGTAWREADFDDSTWDEGAGQLGFGDNDELTVLPSGDDSAEERPITTYFRTTFDASSADFDRLRLRLLADDGTVIYLNGQEIFRGNLPDGPITADTLATKAAKENVLLRDQFGAGALKEGTNVLAVEIHQSSPDSSDLSFDLELYGVRR